MNETIVKEQPTVYDGLLSRMDELSAEVKELRKFIKDNNEQSLRASIIHEQTKTELKNLQRLFVDTDINLGKSNMFLSQMLAEHEGYWDVHNKFESVEFAVQYLAAAKHLFDLTGRVNYNIVVQEWVDEQNA